MKATKKETVKKSRILEEIHENVTDLYRARIIDKVTMDKFDRLCLPPAEPLTPEEIKKIREASHVSQAVFAAALNTSLSTVRQWEIGEKNPAGTALRLLHIIKEKGLDFLFPGILSSSRPQHC